MSTETEPASEPTTPDPAEALRALSVCLRHLACGYGLDPRERASALALLEAGIPGIPTADLDATRKIVATSRRRGGRQREKASDLSVRLAEQAMTRQARAG